ncbi:MAG: replication initiation protein [Fusobacterium necrophorum]|nr:replication initiation protein [Fusobacterium necrophorum]
MNEIVKYHNDLSNQITIKTLNANELNFFMAICSKMKNQETNEVIFDFSQLKELVKWTSNDNKDFVKSLANTNKKLIALNFQFEDERQLVQFVLFPTFRIDKDNKTLTVKVNEEFKFLLNNLSSNFTRFELENFTTLQSKYSKYLYKELMKFKSTGYLIMTIEDFRNKLDIPVKYRMSEIDKKVLTPAKEELSKILKKFEINKIKKGRNIDKIEFSFIPIKNEKIETVEICEIEQYWLDNFSEVNYTSKHKTVIEKLLKTMNESQVINYLKEQWEFVTNNATIENRQAYFSSLILEEKAVFKDYEKQNKIEELSPEEDRQQADEFIGKLFSMQEENEVEMTDENSIQTSFNFSEKKEETIEVTEEEYESKYQDFLSLASSEDTKIQRRIFQNIVGKKYKIKQKKEYTIDDIPEEKLLSKTGKKLVGSALKIRVEKILREMNK